MKRGREATRSARRTVQRRPRAPAATPVERVPLWIVPVVYAAVVVLLFREFFFAGGWLLGMDTYALSYFAREFYTSFVQETGRFPLWQPLVLGGLPFVDGMHGDIFYPVSLALFFLDTRTFWGWKMVLHVFLAGVFCYLWLRTLGLRRGPALFGGLAFMMGADLVSLVYPGGDGKLFVSALAPLSFLLTERAVRSGRLSDHAFFALGITLVVLTSHMQLAYFTVWGVSLWFFFRLWQLRREGRGEGWAVRQLGFFVVAGVLGVGAAAAQFVPPLQYLREWSHRTERTVTATAESAYAFSTTYSLHPEEIASLVVPEFVGQDVLSEGGPTTPYWGRNPFKINSEYAGLVPLLLIPLLFLRRPDPRVWFFVGLGVLSLLYALGANTPFFRLFYLVPGVNLFRAPSLIIFLYGLSIATLGAMALQRLLDATSSDEEGKPIRRTLWIVAGVFGLLALAESAGIVTRAWIGILDVPEARLSALATNAASIRTGFWIAFLLAAGVAVTWEAARVGVFGRAAIVAGLCLLVVLDLHRANRPFIEGSVLRGRFEDQGRSTLFTPDETISFLQSRQAEGEIFRVFDFGPFIPDAPGYGHNDLAVHGIEQVGGHHGNEIGRYRQLVGGEAADNALLSEFRLLDFVNARYAVSPGRLDPAQIPGFEEVFAGSRSVVYRRDGALPRAWLAGTFEVVSDDRAVDRLLSAEFDPRQTAILPEPLPAGVALEPDPQGSVEWTERGANGYTLRVTADRPALLIVAENYYPAWRVTVNGQDAPLIRANYTFRAVPVNAGEQDVRFEYRSDTLNVSVGVSVAILVLLLAVGLGGTLRTWRDRPGGEEAESA